MKTRKLSSIVEMLLLVTGAILFTSSCGDKTGKLNGHETHSEYPSTDPGEMEMPVEIPEAIENIALDYDQDQSISEPSSVSNGFCNGHEWVDLGLPSGTKWATMNVGASSPSDYGDHFAWGETSPKIRYDWSTLKYCLDNSGDKFSKYVIDSKYGSVDDKTELDLSDDAAHENWGKGWRMPSKAQQDELLKKCKWTWATMGEHNGYKVVGPNGNSIFLPAAGWYGSSSDEVGSYGGYWSRTLETSYHHGAYSLLFLSRTIDLYYFCRYYGRSVRAVLNPEALSEYTSIDASEMDMSEEIPEAIEQIDLDFDQNHPISEAKSVVNDHEWVDLGLPSGTRWATMNVGASSPSDYGDYFAWGETKPKENYLWSNLKYCLNNYGNKFSKYVTDSQYGTVDGKKELDLSDDAAYVNWGSGWRMPSREQQDELRTKCTWILTSQERHNGYKVVGPNGNSIFLPAAGYCYGLSLRDGGSHGYYWSRSLSTSSGYPGFGYSAYYLLCDPSRVVWDVYERRRGLSVRAVRLSE